MKVENWIAMKDNSTFKIIWIIIVASNMEQRSQQKQAIWKKIANFCKNLTTNIPSSSFEAVSHQYRKICTQLMYLPRFLKISEGNTGPRNVAFELLLHDSLETIRTMIESVESLKHGHYFPLFQHVLNRFQKLLGYKVANQTQKFLQRLQINEQSEGFRYFRQNLTFKISYSKNRPPAHPGSLMFSLARQQIMLSNPKCIGCSQVFLESCDIQNENQKFSVIRGLHGTKAFSHSTQGKILCAIANAGGGVLIIGTDKIDTCKIKGINFSYEQQLAQKQQFIKEVSLSLSPPCLITIERILVHTNFANPENIAEEYHRYCLRVIIKPHKLSQVTYAEEDSSYVKCFNIYIFDEKEPGQVKLVSTNAKENKYEYMHEMYHKGKKIVLANSHHNIKCFQPCYQFSKIFQENKAGTEHEQVQISSSSSDQDSFSDEVNFKYDLTSLLIVPSRKHCREVKILDKMMQDAGQKFEITLPFSNFIRYVKKSIRCVWMISHMIDSSKIRNMILEGEAKGLIKQSIITVIPVHKNLLIKKLTDEKKKKLEDMFIEMYKKKLEIEKIKGGWMISLDDYGEAIYTFLLLEELNIRPFFVKQTEGQGKKTLD